MNNEEITKIEEKMKDLGLDTKLREINNKEFVLDEKRFIKVNLPDTLKDFETGNGEGIWAIPLTEKEQLIYDSEEIRDEEEEFQVVLLNTSIYYPFFYGTIITVITNQDYRPILSYSWLDGIMKKQGISLQEYLQGNE